MIPSQSPGGSTPLLPSPCPLSPSYPTHSQPPTSPLPPKWPSQRARVPSMRSGEDKGLASTLTTRPGSPMSVRKGIEGIEDGGIRGDGLEDGDVLGYAKRELVKDKSDGEPGEPTKNKTASAIVEISTSGNTSTQGTTASSFTSSKSMSNISSAKDGQANGGQTSERGNDEEEEVAIGSQILTRHPIYPVLQPQAQRSPIAPSPGSSTKDKNGLSGRPMVLTEDFGGAVMNAGMSGVPGLPGETAAASARSALPLPSAAVNSSVMQKTKSQEGRARTTTVGEQARNLSLTESSVGRPSALVKVEEAAIRNKSRADSISSAKARVRTSNLHSTPGTSAPLSSHPSSGPAPSSTAYIPPASGNLRPGDTITFPDNPNLHGCPYCDKVYEGQHARSICRRHQMSKHGIELEVQVKKSRWDNNPNRPATEAEKHKRTLESKRRWAAKDRRRRRAKKLGLPFDELDDDDEDYTDEEGDEIKHESDSPALHYGPGRGSRSQSESFDETKLQVFSPRSDDEVSDEEEDDDLGPSSIVHGTPVSQLRSSGGRVRNTPARYRQDSEDAPDLPAKGKAMQSHLSRRKQPAPASRRLTRAGSTTSSASSYPAVNRLRAGSQADSDTASYQSQSMQPEEVSEQQAAYGWAPRPDQAPMATPSSEYYVDDRGRRRPREARAVRNADGTVSYLYPTSSEMSQLGYSSAPREDLQGDASSSRTRPEVSSRTIAKSNGRPVSKRQGSLSSIQLPIRDDDDNVFGSGARASADDEDEDMEAPITPSKKRTQISRRESSDSDEEAAKVLLAISASPARLPTDATPVHVRVAVEGSGTALFASPSRLLTGEDSARSVQFKEVPGAAALTEDDTTPVRPYNSLSRGAHGRKAGVSGSAGGLWPAQVRRKSISERHSQSEFDDLFHPPSLQSSSAYHPSSSVSRRALDSEPQTPGELDPPVEIMQYDREESSSLYGRQRDPFAHPSDRPDALLSSPLSYSSKPGPATSLVQTSSMRSSTGLSTLSSARLTTPARPGYSTSMAPPTTDRRDMVSPAISGSYPFSSPNGLDLTHKLGLAPTALAPDSPGWLAMVRDTPIVSRGMKRRTHGGSSDASGEGDGEGDDDEAPMLTGREAKRTRV